MRQITIKCRGCGREYRIRRTPEIPIDVDYMGCNWCPEGSCEAFDYYDEWYIYKEKVKIDDTQLNLEI
jgi:hypothetical protein